MSNRSSAKAGRIRRPTKPYTPTSDEGSVKKEQTKERLSGVFKKVTFSFSDVPNNVSYVGVSTEVALSSETKDEIIDKLLTLRKASVAREESKEIECIDFCLEKIRRRFVNPFVNPWDAGYENITHDVPHVFKGSQDGIQFDTLCNPYVDFDKKDVEEFFRNKDSGKKTK